MSGYNYEPGRMQAYGRAPTLPAPVPAAPVDPRYGWSPNPPAPPQRPQPSRTAFAALIVGVAALLVASVALVVVLVIGSDPDQDSGGSGFSAPLTGRLQDAPSGALSGSTLQSAVSKVLLEDGASVTQLTCPATPSVTQGVVTVCHATIDTDPWAVVVLFEDTDGSFTLDLI